MTDASREAQLRRHRNLRRQRLQTLPIDRHHIEERITDWPVEVALFRTAESIVALYRGTSLPRVGNVIEVKLPDGYTDAIVETAAAEADPPISAREVPH